MPIDHFGHDTATFQNRYWVNSTYWEPGGPVFCELIPYPRFSAFSLTTHEVFDSGEQNAEPLLPYYLQVTISTLSIFHGVKLFV